MSPAIRTAFAVGTGVDRDAVAALVAGESSIVIDDFLDAGVTSIDYLEYSNAAAIVVVCKVDHPELLQFIHGAVAQNKHRPVIVFYEGSANGFVRRAFEAGADDLLTGSLAPQSGSGMQLAFAVEKAVARHGVAQENRTELSDFVVVLGPKGGTGKTLVGCNLGAAITSHGSRAILVDLDLQFGDIGLALGLRPDRTIYELATSGGALDKGKIEDFLARHDSGLEVLMAPRRPDQAASVTVPFLQELFGVLRTMADLIIVDTPPSFGPEVIATIDASTQLCVIATLDALSLKNTRLALETLDLMDYPQDDIKVVLNRGDSRVGVTPEDAGSLLGRPPDVLIPSSREIAKSVNEARPIVLTHQNDEARHAFETLAHIVAPNAMPPVAALAKKRKWGTEGTARHRKSMFSRKRPTRNTVADVAEIVEAAVPMAPAPVVAAGPKQRESILKKWLGR